MPYCSILECKNDSRRKNLQNGGISYHRFPKDANVKEQWIDATGRVNWMPTKSSTICSKHFLEADFIISNKGHRYMKPTALPSLKILKFCNHKQNVNEVTRGSSKRQTDTESSHSKKKIRLHEVFEVEQNVIKKEEDEDDVIPVKIDSAHDEETVKNIDDTDGSDCSRLTNKLKGQLRYCKEKIVKQGLKIKRLQSKNRRLQKIIINIKKVLLRLEEKCAAK